MDGQHPAITGEDHPVESKRLVFVFTDVFVALFWLSFLARLFEKWSLTSPDMRECLGVFLVLFCILWRRDVQSATQRNYTLVWWLVGFLQSYLESHGLSSSTYFMIAVVPHPCRSFIAARVGQHEPIPTGAPR